VVRTVTTTMLELVPNVLSLYERPVTSRKL
jgi:hypothetical protein